MNTRFYLDTSVILAAAGPQDAPHHAAATTALTAIAEGTLDAVCSSEVLTECLHVAAWHHARTRGIALVQHLQVLFPHPIAMTDATMSHATDYLRRHSRLGVRAALHAALATSANTVDILSYDADFGLIPGLRRVEPDQVIDGQRSRAR